MSRFQLLISILGSIAFGACSYSTDNNTQPIDGGPLPPNGVSIVAGAQSKGSSAYSPNPLTISLASGGVVRWFNNDGSSGAYGTTGVTHDVTADDGSFTSGNLAAGSKFERAFTTTGEFHYHCNIHPSMTGTIVVTP